jgi:hypothetical protein
MAQCNCGWQLRDPDKLCPRCAALQTLGLEHRASRNEIRDAYRVMVKVWHPDRFSYDAKLRSKAEEKLKEVNAAFQRLNSSAAGPPARAASATEKREAATEAQRPYWTARASTRTYQWYGYGYGYATSARETPRSNASAQESRRKDFSRSGFPNTARPQSNGNARTQASISESTSPINEGVPSASADAQIVRAASATKKPEAKTEAPKPYEIFKTSTHAAQSSGSVREIARPTASAQELLRMDATGLGFPNAARPRSRGNAWPQFLTPEANRSINKGGPSDGAPGPWFSLRRIPSLLVLALLLAFTLMWVNAGKLPATAQDWILNRYYEAAVRKNALTQLRSAPANAVNSVATSSSPSSFKQDNHLSQKRSGTAVSETLRPDDGGQCSPSNRLKFKGAKPCGVRRTATRVHY